MFRPHLSLVLHHIPVGTLNPCCQSTAADPDTAHLAPKVSTQLTALEHEAAIMSDPSRKCELAHILPQVFHLSTNSLAIR